MSDETFLDDNNMNEKEKKLGKNLSIWDNIQYIRWLIYVIVAKTDCSSPHPYVILPYDHIYG